MIDLARLVKRIWLFDWGNTGSAGHWGRTGTPGGDVVAKEGLVPFLGESLSQHGLFYEDGLKLVSYGGAPGTIVQSGAMESTIILDDPTSDYQTLNIPEEVLVEAEIILASFAVGSTAVGKRRQANTL